MAIGWLTVLSSVPWTEVINNAPKVADGARKLWKSVSGKSGDAQASNTPAHAGAEPEALTLPAMAARITELESVVADLHAQMLASSELVKALADQNTELVRRVEANRVRTGWLAALSAVALIMAAVALLT